MSPPVEPPSTSEFISLRGLRFHVRRWGDVDRPWILLGSGWLDCSATFGPLVAGLLPDFHVLSADWRGLGLSEWPQDGYWFQDYLADVDALLDHLQPRAPVAMVGHSMGAQVLSLYAGVRPERVSRLAILDGLMLPDRGPEYAVRNYRRWLIQLKKPRAQRYYASFDDLALRVRRQHPQLDATWSAFVARGWGAEEPDGRIRLLADPLHHLSMPTCYRVAESEAIWREITCPVLFIDAERSLFAAGLAPGELIRRREAFAQRRQVAIADVGHMLHWDAPKETAQHLHAFFSEPSLT